MLSNYSTDIYNRCGSSGDWLMPRNASWPLAPSISFSNNVYPVDTDIAVYYYQSSYVYSVTPVVYLNTSTKIYSLNSDGSLNNPFKLKNIT